MRFISYCIRFAAQIVIFSLAKLFLWRGKTTPHPSVLKGERTIIIANHQHSRDPFVIISSLSYSAFFRLAPFSFMTANIFYKPLWVRPFAWLAGCFPSHPLTPTNTFYGVPAATQLLTQGYTLVMFPEGKRTTKRLPAKRGLKTILENQPVDNLILARIKWQDDRVVYLRLASHDASDTDSDAMLDTIYKL